MRLFALLLCWPLWAGATTYYAAPGGGAAANCTDVGANVCTLARCVTVALAAGNTHTCNLAAGNYVGTELGASGYVLMSGGLVSLECATYNGCTLRPSAATAGVRLNGPPNNGLVSLIDLNVDGVNGTAPNYCYWAQDSAGGSYTVTLTRADCRNPNTYGIYSAATGINLAVNDSDMTATSAVAPRSFLFTERASTQWAAGSISVVGGTASIDKHATGAAALINIEAFAAGLTASVSGGFVGNVTLDPTLTSTGEHGGIQLLNVGNASITDATMNVYGNVGDRSTALFRINSCGDFSPGTAGQGCAGTETPRAITAPVIRNVTGTIGTPNGYGAIIGQDATSSANNQITAGRIENADITCTASGNAGHGVMLGYLVGGLATRSTSTGCGINFIAKMVSTTPALFAGNASFNAGDQHYRAKGALVTWTNNDAISLSDTGDLFYADDETVSSTHSTISAYNNVGYVNGGSPTYALFVGTASTLTAANANDWYGGGAWSNNGSAYATLSLWNADAAVGTDLAVNPRFVGGASPANDQGLRLLADSPLRRVGIDLNVGNIQDNGNRPFAHPPSIGAWEAASGDAASTRTAATTRTAAFPRTAATARTAR